MARSLAVTGLIRGSRESRRIPDMRDSIRGCLEGKPKSANPCKQRNRS